MTCAIAACARNEGPFIVEWLAHHLSIGFDKIFVATNDCDDGSDILLQKISQYWPVIHIDNTQQLPGLTIQRSAMGRCLAHPEMQDQDWVLHIDLDEFLNIQSTAPNIQSFVQSYEPFDAVMLFWKIFGAENQNHWLGGSVVDTFQGCQTDLSTAAVQKAMFRRKSFRDVAPHSPKDPTKPQHELKVVTTLKEHIDATKAYNHRGTALQFQPHQATWNGAFVNHYIHKSTDLSRLIAKIRGDANGRGNEMRAVGGREYEAFNLNDGRDFSIHTNRAARIDWMNKLLATPGVLAAHHDSMHWYQNQLLEIDQGAQLMAAE